MKGFVENLILSLIFTSGTLAIVFIMAVILGFLTNIGIPITLSLVSASALLVLITLTLTERFSK